MTIDLPAPVAAYFAADQADDGEALVRSFAEDAVVKDEGASHVGRDAIRAWWRAAKDRSQHAIEPLRMSERGGELVVASRVTGDFPGSPINLDFIFALSGEAIRRLEIRP